METNSDLFPAFRQFVVESGLLEKAKGSLAARIPRILGQGKTKSVGYDAPPAPIERKAELAGLLRSDIQFPDTVVREISQAAADLQALQRELLTTEGVRRVAVSALRAVGNGTGVKDNRYYAGGFILTHEKGGFDWSWSVTPHYPVIKKLPPDANFIADAYKSARTQIERFTVPAAEFESRLKLAWTLARHFSDTDDVFVTDVMRMFNIAAQPERFWQAPKRQNYVDIPEAAFVLSLMNARRQGASSMAGLEFVPATLHQAHGKSAKVFYLPLNAEGTEVRPMVYLRPR